MNETTLTNNRVLKYLEKIRKTSPARTSSTLW